MISERQKEIVKIVRQNREMTWEEVYRHFYPDRISQDGYASKKMKTPIEELIDRGYLAVREEKDRGKRGRPARILSLRE